MTDDLEFSVDWEDPRGETPEERACFAEIGLRWGDIWLTEADDSLVKRTRTRIRLSGYLLAEWLAWNWWRLRWEPKRPGSGWALAHHMSSVGGGWIWPNIVVYSDGRRVLLEARSTSLRPEEPIRYLGNSAALVSDSVFERCVDMFLDRVEERLSDEGISDTNFQAIWREVREERGNPAKAEWRKLEAVLGFDPDEADPELIERLSRDGEEVGSDAVLEMAARGGDVPTVTELRAVSTAFGVEWNSKDMVRVRADGSYRPKPTDPPWERGRGMARAIRSRERLGDGPIPGDTLERMLGVSAGTSREGKTAYGLVFSLSADGGGGTIVLDTGRETSRRFKLARLLGDAISSRDLLHPATDAKTYRQRFQRAFAAELLCPYEALDSELGETPSEDQIQDVAECFGVSPRTVDDSLRNNRRSERDGYREDFAA